MKSGCSHSLGKKHNRRLHKMVLKIIQAAHQESGSGWRGLPSSEGREQQWAVSSERWAIARWLQRETEAQLNGSMGIRQSGYTGAENTLHAVSWGWMAIVERCWIMTFCMLCLCMFVRRSTFFEGAQHVQSKKLGVGDFRPKWHFLPTTIPSQNKIPPRGSQFWKPIPPPNLSLDELRKKGWEIISFIKLTLGW